MLNIMNWKVDLKRCIKQKVIAKDIKHIVKIYRMKLGLIKVELMIWKCNKRIINQIYNNMNK